ncbi:beta-galactosidase-1-like protein 2 [Onthophagus taurus]|uniref:beta-galactosidase-1-like protein 2 n=1 Tax=Onthophagus taurus TaxID=166361 RepID=UPI0039BEBF21
MSLPTLYQHYTSGGITEGLNTNQPYFTLNQKNITLYSGALHYFRVPQEYWRDRLRKMKAAGINTVETYVPWNLHEPEPGLYDFGAGGSDFQEFLDIEKFLKMAQEEDMLAIVRPGPYICSEWDFGGLPSWLLKEKGIRVRTSDEKFMNHVTRFFNTLLTLLAALQFTRGGPIIAVQIENEYGSANSIDYPIDMDYMEQLRGLMKNNGIVELFVTSDGPSYGNLSQMEGVLYTGNFQDNPEHELGLIEKYQPGKPIMVMEFWTGWFDHWLANHQTRPLDKFLSVLETILDYPSSVNFYMFHGGTNFGFTNGANILGLTDGGNKHDTTSYDYDAPLSENGDYTEKYFALKEAISKRSNPQLYLPPMPELTPRIAYNPIEITGELRISDLLKSESYVESENVISMENIDINNGGGQRFGYVVYKKENLNIKSDSILKIEGRVYDTILVLINGELKSKILTSESDVNGFGYWRVKDASLNLGLESYEDATLELIVENSGRVNFGTLNQFNQQKGLFQGNVLLNDEIILNWKIHSLEFKKNWTNSLTGWETPTFKNGPALYRGVLNVENPDKDTYIDLRDWRKGVVIVNGFVLSRHFRVGPQLAAYLPAPLLKSGDNEIIFFEHFVGNDKINFLSDMVYGGFDD